MGQPHPTRPTQQTSSRLQTDSSANSAIITELPALENGESNSRLTFDEHIGGLPFSQWLAVLNNRCASPLDNSVLSNTLPNELAGTGNKRERDGTDELSCHVALIVLKCPVSSLAWKLERANNQKIARIDTDIVRFAPNCARAPPVSKIDPSESGLPLEMILYMLIRLTCAKSAPTTIQNTSKHITIVQNKARTKTKATEPVIPQFTVRHRLPKTEIRESLSPRYQFLPTEVANQ
jgi:hypothetical protein